MQLDKFVVPSKNIPYLSIKQIISGANLSKASMLWQVVKNSIQDGIKIRSLSPEGKTYNFKLNDKN